MTGFVAGLARSTVANGVTINNLLRGTFDNFRLAGNFAAQVKREDIAADEFINAASRNTPPDGKTSHRS